MTTHHYRLAVLATLVAFVVALTVVPSVGAGPRPPRKWQSTPTTILDPPILCPAPTITLSPNYVGADHRHDIVEAESIVGIGQVWASGTYSVACGNNPTIAIYVNGSMVGSQPVGVSPSSTPFQLWSIETATPEFGSPVRVCAQIHPGPGNGSWQDAWSCIDTTVGSVWR